MTQRLVSTLLASGENLEHSETTMTVSPWWFGAGTLLAFLVVLWAVTRLNLDR
jgi:hypothetical protein